MEPAKLDPELFSVTVRLVDLKAALEQWGMPMTYKAIAERCGLSPMRTAQIIHRIDRQRTTAGSYTSSPKFICGIQELLYEAGIYLPVQAHRSTGLRTRATEAREAADRCMRNAIKQMNRACAKQEAAELAEAKADNEDRLWNAMLARQGSTQAQCGPWITGEV